MMKKFGSESLNSVLQSMDIYASKAISLEAKNRQNSANLAFGEPFFGPPDFLLGSISEDLNIKNFLDATKRYEEPKGSPSLRGAIANWYLKHYNLVVDPEHEIMITHGGVEAITLALLTISQSGDQIAVTDPSYMLYKRSIESLGRSPLILSREAVEEEYLSLAQAGGLLDSHRPKALIVNSPENPTGYVLSETEWKMLGERTASSGTWLIHDEVYDVMAFQRKHQPARAYKQLAEHSILINSFSKKFGLPGLRIGWLCAPSHVIDLAAKIHDYLYLGVNILFERIAERIISHPEIMSWHSDLSKLLEKRALIATERLGINNGFSWPRHPLGAMFLFPNIYGLYQHLPNSYTRSFSSSGEAVARYLMESQDVAVVPGSVYGPGCQDNIRLVTCTPEDTYMKAIERLSRISV